MSDMISDEQLAIMLAKMQDGFGEAQSEKITENSYEFNNRGKEMREQYDFLNGVNDKSKRLYLKNKYGFDQ